MAFTPLSETTTYGTDRIPLVWSLDLNAGASNLASPFAGMMNVIPFVADHNNTGSSYSPHDVYGETRDAIAAHKVFSDTAIYPIVRGMHVWEITIGTIYYFVVFSFNGSTYVYSSTDTVTWTNLQTLATDGPNPVRFTEFIDDTNTKKLILVDGTDGYIFTGNAAGTRIVDANFPTPHIPFPVFMDGYLFLAKAGTSDIYNSNLNDPATWTAGSFISAEMYPDDLQALVRLGSYILAIGVQSSEYLFDAGNSPGTPLALYEGATLPFGTAFPNSIASNFNTVMLLANNNDGESIFKVIEGTNHTDVPAVAVLRVFQDQMVNGVDRARSVRGMFLRQNGQLIYVFNQWGDLTSQNLSDTMAYTFNTKHWIKLNVGPQAANGFPVYFTAPASSKSPVTYLVGVYPIAIPSNPGVNNNTLFFGHFDPTAPNDILDVNFSAYSINQYIYVPPQNFDTLNRKRMHRLGVIYSTTLDTPSLLTVSWSDDLMNTFTSPVAPQGQAGGSFATGGGYPFITQLGYFRQRGFKVQEVVRCRFNFLEVVIDKGSN